MDILEFIENLHPNKGVEHQRLQLIHLLLRLIIQDMRSGEMKNERSNELEDGLSDDHLPHV